MRAGKLLLVAALGAAALGCARKVVLDPVLVPGRNNPAWVIHQPPAPTRAGRASAPAGAPVPTVPRKPIPPPLGRPATR